MNQIPAGAIAVGYRALVEKYQLNVVPHYRWSFIIPSGARRSLQGLGPEIYLYDRDYAVENPKNSLHQLEFALKHEGLNLEIVRALFTHVQHDEVFNYVSQHSSGKYERITWFLYEKLTEKRLDIVDLERGAYVDLLNMDDYFTTPAIQHRRYRINDNMLGNFAFCPLMRRTVFLESFEAHNFDKVANDLLSQYDRVMLERASHYLYVQETISSYRIERERPSKQRLSRFIQLVKQAETIPVLTQKILAELQGAVVDARFATGSYRTIQNYVGQSIDWQRQIVHYISPKPDDVADLMQGLLNSLQRMLDGGVHPIVIAASISFGFVFIHPFDDGNGRLHRFLIHYILQRTNFTPSGMIFPVSATILADMKRYSLVLENFSKSLMKAITDYELSNEGVLTVQQDTVGYYRFIDYTTYAEFLADCVAKTIECDFKKELEYLVQFDKAKAALSDIVDMSDHLLDLFISVVMQNHGKLSQGKRESHFSKLTDNEVKEMESVIGRLLMIEN
jgi:hypothetical protein